MIPFIIPIFSLSRSPYNIWNFKVLPYTPPHYRTGVAALLSEHKIYLTWLSWNAPNIFVIVLLHHLVLHSACCKDLKSHWSQWKSNVRIAYSVSCPVVVGQVLLEFNQYLLHCVSSSHHSSEYPLGTFQIHTVAEMFSVPGG